MAKQGQTPAQNANVTMGVGAGVFWGCEGYFSRIYQICPKKFYAAQFISTNFL